MSKHRIPLELTSDEAEAMAQFFKRVTLTTYRQHAANNEEAYVMKDAGDVLSKALREAGFSPR